MFAVYAPDTHKILKLKRVSTRELEQMIGDASWQHAKHGGKNTKQLKVPWPKVM